MNYAYHYEKLIARARSRTLVGYKERHHALPKCMGGGNEPENLVELTPEEHFVAHQLLIRIHPGIKKLVYAAWYMATNGKGNKPYGWLRRRHATCMSVALLGNTRRLGIRHSKEAREKISAAGVGRISSPERKAKISIAKLGNKNFLGKTHSPETSAKMSDSRRSYWAKLKAVI
jgi:hypothetical protein